MNPQDPCHPRLAVGHVLHRLYRAGAEMLAADLTRQLKDRYRFVFLCLDEIGPLGEELAGEGFTVIDLKRTPGVDLALAKRLAQAVGEHRIGLLHAHQYTPFFYASASRLPPARFWPTGRPPILFTEHGRHYPDERRAKRVLANRFLLAKRDRVTAVATWIKQALIDHEGIAGHRIEVVLNGIDPTRFSLATPELRRKVRRELGLADHQVAIMQVARFHPVKDHETAVRGFADAQTQVPGPLEPILFLVGEGEKKEAVESQVRQLGLSDRVRFLGIRKDIARLLAAADVFLLSSLSEGISVTLLEAMGAGLPIVATNVGGNGEVVADGQTGLLSPRGDAQTLGRNLARLITEADLRSRLGGKGRKRLLDIFTQDRMHARYAAIYHDMLALAAPSN